MCEERQSALVPLALGTVGLVLLGLMGNITVAPVVGESHASQAEERNLCVLPDYCYSDFTQNTEVDPARRAIFRFPPSIEAESARSVTLSRSPSNSRRGGCETKPFRKLS